MTNEEILAIAMEQSAIDNNAAASDFRQTRNVIVPSALRPLARKYLKAPIACNLVSYGSNVVASTREECREIVEAYLRKFAVPHCFETPNLHWLDDRMEPLGYRSCFMAEYFLPDVKRLGRLECGFDLRVLTHADFELLYVPAWSNALCADRRELDVLGVGAYDGQKLIGLAACSADCETMWQIGIDVLPEYRRQSVASGLTGRLALEILERGKVPFYCAAWSNLGSVRNALRSGFTPAWVELTVKTVQKVAELNRL